MFVAHVFGLKNSKNEVLDGVGCLFVLDRQTHHAALLVA